MSVIAPQNLAQLSDAIHTANSTRTRLRIVGGGTRQALGQPVAADMILSTQKLSGIVDYDPGSLCMVVRAGTSMDEIDRALTAAGQRLAFEPPDYRRLLGTQGSPTIGAIIACNLSGPRRVLVGAARDHLLGVQFVNGRGEQVKSGGRVMKNVTGLDLAKLICGSYGTLGVLHEVALKTLPKPAKSQTLAFDDMDVCTALGLFTAALKTPYEVAGAYWRNNTAYLRIEGTELQVKNRLAALRNLIDGKQAAKIQRNADAQWLSIRDLHDFATGQGSLWRLSIKPSCAPELVELLRAKYDASIALDWAGGLVWAQMPAQDGLPVAIHALLARYNGHATLIRGDEQMRAQGVFQPVAPLLARLSADLRAQFDPNQILNPGIMG